MLLDQCERLKSHFSKLILATQSQKMFEIFNLSGLAERLTAQNFLVIPSAYNGDIDRTKFGSPEEYCMALATGKALQLESDLFVTGELDMIISSATVIVLDGEIYETPKNPAEASRMLQSLSGKTHQVITAVVLRYLGMNNLRTGHKFTEESAVTFSALSDALVDAYVETGEPMRHIGGYSIQGIGGSFVSGIRGCFHNVMGFPIVRFGNEVLMVMDNLETMGPRPPRQTALDMLQQMELDDDNYNKHVKQIMEEWNRDMMAMESLTEEQLGNLDMGRTIDHGMIKSLKKNMDEVAKTIDALSRTGVTGLEANTSNAETGPEIEVEHEQSAEPSTSSNSKQSNPFNHFLQEQEKILKQLEALKAEGVNLETHIKKKAAH
jgi:septum formation protein